jgi:uncharacterized membrane protein YhaH (DUF805 family)
MSLYRWHLVNNRLRASSLLFAQVMWAGVMWGGVMASVSQGVSPDTPVSASPASDASVVDVPHLTANQKSEHIQIQQAEALPFVRVHVPPGRLAEVSAAGERYIPMAAAEFEEAVGQLAFTVGGDRRGMPQPAADCVTYRARLDEAGRLRGEVEFNVPAVVAGFLPVGQIALKNCQWRPADEQTADPVAVDLCGLLDGSVELRLPGPGQITADVLALPRRVAQPPVQAVPLAGGEPEYAFELPLIPALATTLELDLPSGLVPRAAGVQASRVASGKADTEEQGRQCWRFLFGPRRTVELELAAAGFNRMTVWSSVRIGRRVTQVDSVMRPETTWKDRTIRLTTAGELLVTSGRVGPPDDRASLQVEQVRTASGDWHIRLPLAAMGTAWPLQIDGIVAGTGLAESTIELPGFALSGKCWAGGGMRVEIDPDLQCAQVNSLGWLPVTRVEADRWPLQPITADGVALLTFQQQQAERQVRLTTAARRPEFDIARVTTIDVTTTRLVARAACDVKVRRGRVHQLEARIGPEWLIDSVEPIVLDQDRLLSGKSLREEGGEQPSSLDEGAEQLTTRYEWNVVRREGGDQLILDLPTAITPDRELRLRITGHRRGVPAGGRFQSTEADMVQLKGEAMGQVWIDFHTSPETTLVESEQAAPPPPFGPRLSQLAEAKAWRQRVPGGRFATPQEFLFLRRRPPLDAEAQTRLTIRGEQLNETFSFTCQPQQGELDALTIHFSEPVGQLDWAVLNAAKTTVFARRLEPIEQPVRGLSGAANWQAAESWLIELTPPLPGVTTIRATGSRPFIGPVAVPLAWVEAAVAPQGELFVQAVGRDRPQVRNHRLKELPPRDRSAAGPLETVSELSYDLETALDGTGPAVELIPLPAAARPVPRGWVWQEKTTVRCYASAAAEYETQFSIENDGRKSFLLTVPATHRLLGVSIDNERLSLPAARVGTLPIYLPEGQRQVQLTVRSASVGNTQRGVWSLPTEVPALDAPTLTRQWQVLLPSMVQLLAIPSGFREISQAPIDWIGRLLGGQERGQFTRSPGTARPIDRPLTERQFVPVAGRHRQESFVLVEGWVLTGVAAVLAALTAGLGMMVSWQRSWLVVAVLVLASVAALWLPEPGDQLARAVLWTGLGVTVLRLGRMVPGGSRRAGLAGLLFLLASPVAPAEQPLQVFLTPVEGETTALVPESLFRVLAATATDARRNGIRILDCRVEITPSSVNAGVNGQELWWLNLLVESDAATALPLDQAPTESCFAELPLRVDGGVVRASLSGNRQRVVVSLPAPGLHMLAIPINPVWTRRGDVEVTTVRLPVSPQTTLVWPGRERAEAPLVSGRWMQCEWALADGRFQLAGEPQAEESGVRVLQLPAAEQIRLIRPVDPEARLTSVIREAESSNQVNWAAGNCRLTARFLIRSGNTILPTIWLQADPRLVLTIPDETDPSRASPVDYDIVRVADGVFRIDQRTPVKGPVQLEIPFTMPLATTVGRFDLPDVWLRSAQVDHREVVLEAGADYEVAVRFPGSVAPPQIEEQTGSETTVKWSTDIVEVMPAETLADKTSADTANSVTAGLPRLQALHRQSVRIEVLRRGGVIRGRQQLVVAAERFGTKLVFEATIDARLAVWTDDRIMLPPGFVLENLQVFEQDGPEGEGKTVDIYQQAESAQIQRLVFQQPATGQYLLRLTARSDRPLPSRGQLPLIRSNTAESFPLSVVWDDQAARGCPELIAPRSEDREEEQAPAAITPLREDSPSDQKWRFELPSSSVNKRFRIRPLVAEDKSSVKEPSGESDQEKPSAAAVAELADIEVIIDERGRISGVGRFDLITKAAAVQLRLPEGFRLFELLLDGRQVRPQVPNRETPSDIWTIPLQGGPWPHEILLVFVGELGEELFQGEPVSFALPELLGLPVERMLLTINSSKSQVLRVATPAEPLTSQAASLVREDANAAIDRAITAMVPIAAKETRARITRFRGQRLSQLTTSPLEAWAGRGPIGSMLVGASRQFSSPLDSGRWQRAVFTSGQGAVGVTVRFAGATTGNRGQVGVTLLILVAGVASWWTLTQRPARMLAVAARWWPVVVALVAAFWLITRQPIWPGVGLALLAGGTLVRRLLLWWQTPAEQPAGPQPAIESNDSQTQGPVAAAAEAVTTSQGAHESVVSTVSHRSLS